MITLKNGVKIDIVRFAEYEYGLIGPVPKTAQWSAVKIHIHFLRDGLPWYISWVSTRETWKDWKRFIKDAIKKESPD